MNNPGIAIKQFEEINNIIKLDKPKSIKQMNIKYICNLNGATLIPITKNVYYEKNIAEKPISTISSEQIEKNIKESFNYELLKILDDKKLENALELFSKNKQFSNKTQFINLITILEILAEKKMFQEKK